MYLTKAKKLLNQEYQQRYKENVSGYHIEVMDEKIRHSYQVLGAGNFLLRHEPCFASLSPKEIDKLQAAVLLHDIGRFYEILMMKDRQFVDHGVYGAKMLAQIPEFNQKDIVLPIRHHGHLIEALYADEEYMALADEEKAIIRRNAFLVRDADKLANFYLLATHFEEYGPMFLVASEYKDANSKDISEKIREDFFNHKCVTRSEIRNLAEKALSLWAWIYDINYDSSFLFMERLHLTDRLFKFLSRYLKEDDARCIKDEMDKFIAERHKKSS